MAYAVRLIASRGGINEGKGVKMITSRTNHSLPALPCLLLTIFMVLTANANSYQWANPQGGDWGEPSNWSPNGIPITGDSATITLPGTYTVTATNNLVFTGLILGGSSGTQTLVYGLATAGTYTNLCTIQTNGVLVVTNGGLTGDLTIAAGGQLQLAGLPPKYLYNLSLLNKGTVMQSGGGLAMGGTTIANDSLWQITGDTSINQGGSTTPVWFNAGVLRKSGGTLTSAIAGLQFINLPGGLVDVQAGTLQFYGNNTNLISGTFNATTPGVINFAGGFWTDGGGTATGTGLTQLTGGSLLLCTNIIPGLLLTGGEVYTANPFQASGAITNLTLDGATLAGTNVLGNGTLTVNSGALTDQLTVETNGQLLLASSATKVLYGLSLINQGYVLWSGGFLNLGTTTVSNGGQWQMTSDNVMAYGGGATPVWTNSGLLRKSAGTGTSFVASFIFYNQPGGLVEADSGTVVLSSITTNLAGGIRLNGGQIVAAGTLAFAGGTLDGSGSVGANALTGGLISPGQGGPGLLTFTSGLNLGGNAILSVDGIGLAPGGGYDQLSVTGGVALGQATLQVTALPVVADGVTFIIIDNQGTAPVNGTFNGLAENAILAVGSQLFRISYHGGDGNDVALTRIDNTNAAALFTSVKRMRTGTLQLAATGLPGLTYSVQATDDLTTNNWITLGNITADSLGNLAFTDATAPNYSVRFYRWVWP